MTDEQRKSDYYNRLDAYIQRYPNRWLQLRLYREFRDLRLARRDGS